jgi:hypothetical protein
LPDLSKIKYDGSIQFKKDTHVYYGEKYTIEGEWLNGVPHGICIIENENMRGVFTFNKGKTDGGPIWYEMKASGHRLSLEYGDIEYKNHKGYFRSYNSDRSMSNLDSKSAKPGYLNSIGRIKEKTELNGKVFCENGDIKEGKLVICEE